MFVRTKTTPNSPRKSVQVVEAYRVDGKVKQKIVRHIGIAMDDESLARLLELAEYEKAQLEAQHQPQLFSPEDICEQIRALPEKQDVPSSVHLRELREEARVVVGIHQVYGALYQQLNLDAVFGARQAGWRDVFKDMVMARIANPASKRDSVRMLEEDFGLHHSVDHVYRLLDKLDDAAIERLQRIALQQATDLVGQALTVLFYDCTTLYFESFDEDDLRQKGFSKDHKTQETQVLLAVMTTPEGLPVGYEVFPGATFEGHSLIPVLTALKARY
ncbi:MAG: IS1634 family transposase, partial [Pseudomonadota bacterium]